MPHKFGDGRLQVANITNDLVSCKCASSGEVLDMLLKMGVTVLSRIAPF